MAPMLVAGPPPKAYLKCIPVGLAHGIQLRFDAQVSPESLGVTARKPSRCNGSDQLSQGVSRLLCEPGDSPCAVVNAAVGDPGHAQQPGFAARDEAFCQTLP